MKKEKCRICGIAETTKMPPGMIPGFWICSAACMDYSHAHPENNPHVKLVPGTDDYDVSWEDTVDGEPASYRVYVNRESESYVCPCGQPAHPDFVPKPGMQQVAAYMPGIDGMETACKHIRAVLFWELTASVVHPSGGAA